MGLAGTPRSRKKPVALLIVAALLVLAAVFCQRLDSLLHWYQEWALLREPIKGKMLRLFVPSRDLHRRNKLFVYLPPGYFGGRRSYPVIYLLHGMPGDARDWFVKGRAHLTAEELILRRRVRPVILVSFQATGPNGPQDRTDYLNSSIRKLYVEDYLAHELPAYVEKTWRVRRGSSSAALIGLSSGGYGALNVGTRHTDRFGIIASHSGFTNPEVESRYVRRMLGPPGLAWTSNDPLDNVGRWCRKGLSIYLDVGRSDDLRKENDALADALTRWRVRHAYHVVPGGHHWSLWRSRFRHSLLYVDRSMRELSAASRSQGMTPAARPRSQR